MFIIQTRKESAVREAIKSSSGSADDWKNEPHEYEVLKSAQKESEALIQSGRQKAENIRIVKVVCTFEAEIKIKATEPEKAIDYL